MNGRVWNGHQGLYFYFAKTYDLHTEYFDIFCDHHCQLYPRIKWHKLKKGF